METLKMRRAIAVMAAVSLVFLPMGWAANAPLDVKPKGGVSTSAKGKARSAPAKDMQFLGTKPDAMFPGDPSMMHMMTPAISSKPAATTPVVAVSAPTAPIPTPTLPESALQEEPIIPPPTEAVSPTDEESSQPSNVYTDYAAWQQAQATWYAHQWSDAFPEYGTPEPVYQEPAAGGTGGGVIQTSVVSEAPAPVTTPSESAPPAPTSPEPTAAVPPATDSAPAASYASMAPALAAPVQPPAEDTYDDDGNLVLSVQRNTQDQIISQSTWTYANSVLTSSYVRTWDYDAAVSTDTPVTVTTAELTYDGDNPAQRTVTTVTRDFSVTPPNMETVVVTYNASGTATPDDDVVLTTGTSNSTYFSSGLPQTESSSVLTHSTGVTETSQSVWEEGGNGHRQISESRTRTNSGDSAPEYEYSWTWTSGGPAWSEVTIERVFATNGSLTSRTVTTREYLDEAGNQLNRQFEQTFNGSGVIQQSVEMLYDPQASAELRSSLLGDLTSRSPMVLTLNYENGEAIEFIAEIDVYGDGSLIRRRVIDLRTNQTWWSATDSASTSPIPTFYTLPFDDPDTEETNPAGGYAYDSAVWDSTVGAMVYTRVIPFTATDNLQITATITGKGSAIHRVQLVGPNSSVTMANGQTFVFDFDIMGQGTLEPNYNGTSYQFNFTTVTGAEGSFHTGIRNFGLTETVQNAQWGTLQRSTVIRLSGDDEGPYEGGSLEFYTLNSDGTRDRFVSSEVWNVESSGDIWHHTIRYRADDDRYFWVKMYPNSSPPRYSYFVTTPDDTTELPLRGGNGVPSLTYDDSGMVSSFSGNDSINFSAATITW